MLCILPVCAWIRTLDSAHEHRGRALTEPLDFTDRGRHEHDSPTESPTEARHGLTDRMRLTDRVRHPFTDRAQSAISSVGTIPSVRVWYPVYPVALPPLRACGRCHRLW